MPGELFYLTEHVGKTIQSWTSQYFGHQEYWKITFTDDTILHVVSETDYSDIHCDMKILTDAEAQEFLYEFEEEDDE